MTTKDKASTTEQLSLVFELYRRIPQGRKVTAKQLQSELADAGIYRGIRSVQRNLDVIVDYFNVDKDTRSKPFGYSRRICRQPTLGAREIPEDADELIIEKGVNFPTLPRVRENLH